MHTYIHAYIHTLHTLPYLILPCVTLPYLTSHDITSHHISLHYITCIHTYVHTYTHTCVYIIISIYIMYIYIFIYIHTCSWIEWKTRKNKFYHFSRGLQLVCLAGATPEVASASAEIRTPPGPAACPSKFTSWWKSNIKCVDT